MKNNLVIESHCEYHRNLYLIPILIINKWNKQQDVLPLFDVGFNIVTKPILTLNQVDSRYNNNPYWVKKHPSSLYLQWSSLSVKDAASLCRSLERIDIMQHKTRGKRVKAFSTALWSKDGGKALNGRRARGIRNRNSISHSWFHLLLHIWKGIFTHYDKPAKGATQLNQFRLRTHIVAFPSEWHQTAGCSLI